jgi:hypothetical protein
MMSCEVLAETVDGLNLKSVIVIVTAFEAGADADGDVAVEVVV